ncbi:hypothetical protein CWI38_0022p0050 [Hamiltosporidium tvaerminnensis]|uniref:Uncharacterized protein n=1 Tax=Hamiltosporidium tvaerminnensis TaxID=1176355 RepID=A0A4Q9M278_9MICR|nr:hypothetical protein CWI38_0022p0050 [Hamiltosporidium tvaerminnensis]
MKKVKSTEILIKRKSITKRKRHPLSVKETNISYETIPNKEKYNEENHKYNCTEDKENFYEGKENFYQDKENINEDKTNNNNYNNKNINYKSEKSIDAETINSSIKIETPKRKIIILTPNAYCEIKGSPEYKRYQCVRKIDFI